MTGPSVRPARNVRGFVNAATWVVPAAVFLLAGLGKLLAPRERLPDAWNAFLPSASPALIQAGLAALEIAVALGLVLRATRRAARYAAFLLLAGFSAFLAWNAGDARFAESCGCFGEVPWFAGRPVFRGFEGALFRNALLMGLVALGADLAPPASRPLRTAAARAAVSATLVLLATLWAGERQVSAATRGKLRSVESGQTLLAHPGWNFPDLPLLDADGRATTADRAFRGNDVLVFVNASCAHCRRLGTAWSRLAEDLERRGGRLVFVATEDEGDFAAFKAECGCAATPHVVLARRDDVRRLGIRGVPQILALDASREVVLHEGESRGMGFTESLEAAAARVPNLEAVLWTEVASVLFGPGSTCSAVRSVRRGVRCGEVRGPDGPRGRLCVLTGPGTPPGYLEIAVALDAEGRLRDVLPLARGARSRIVDPEGRLLDGLRGATLEEAVDRATRASKEATLEAPVWSTAAALLEQLR